MNIAKKEIELLSPQYQRDVNTIATALRELVAKHKHLAILAIALVWEEIVTKETPADPESPEKTEPSHEHPNPES